MSVLIFKGGARRIDLENEVTEVELIEARRCKECGGMEGRELSFGDEGLSYCPDCQSVESLESVVQCTQCNEHGEHDSGSKNCKECGGDGWIKN